MAFASASRQLVGVVKENFQGTQVVPGAPDVLPLIRSVKVTPKPIRVDRPTLRLSLSGLADISPGQAIVDVEFTYELHASAAYVAGAGVTSSMRPFFTRAIQACGYAFTTEQTSQQGLYSYALTSIAGSNPLVDGETVVGNTTPGSGNTIFGDTYGDDGFVLVDHGSTALVGTTFTGALSGAVATVGARNVTECFGWRPTSTPTNPISGAGQSSMSVTVWKDGKRLQIKGAMGNTEFQFVHGDAVLCRTTMSGVFVNYTDSALPTNPNESHKYPPTFLGSRLTLREISNAPTNSNKYGSDGGGAGVITGGLNRMTINTGNEVVLRENSMDPNGVNFATIANREPGGSFNPDEVANADFDFISRFVNGTPVRMRCIVNGPGSSTPVYNNPATNNQNSYMFSSPGLVFDGMADIDRDNVNVWDASFKLTGGDYDQTALGELPGNDNELIIAHF